MLSPSFVAKKLGIELDYSPGLDCLWDGEKLHTAICKPFLNDDDEDVFIIRDNNDAEGMFHEFAHILLCPADRIGKKDFGTVWNPLSYVPHVTQETSWGGEEPADASYEEDWEENAADTLCYFMMLYCGYEEEVIFSLIRSYNKSYVWERGISHPKIFEAWELFLLLMKE